MSSFRCTGHCCRRFAIEHSFDELQADYVRWRRDPTLATIPDIEKIAPMVTPIASNVDAKEYVYSCKNLGPNGDCTIYEVRPQMCRDFPGEEKCHFWKCESDVSAYYGMGIIRKIVTRYSWLRKLGKNG